MKEIIAGTGLAVVIFLAIVGVNVMPVVLLAAVVLFFYYFLQNQGLVRFEELGSGVKKPSQITFTDIGGQESAVSELKVALQFIIRAEEVALRGIRPLKGVLLVGPPGTGTTLLARAAASFTSSAFVAVSGSEFIEMYAGVGARRVRQLFADARKKAAAQKHNSAIVFIDELEVLGTRRGSHSGHMEYDQTLNQLLVEMDGINAGCEPHILLIGATNRVDMLDPALLRPGRFDRQVQVGLPDRHGRRKILEIHTRNKKLADMACLDEVARATFGFSGAHLESLANEAAILALREDVAVIELRHLNEAIDKVIMGEKLERKPSQAEMERISTHEAGHAVMSEVLEPGSVSSLTIVSRGKALGFMRKSPRDDQYLYTREELEKQIMVALGGAAAEDLCLGNRSNGARNDFSQAWELAREIIESGLSELGVVHGEDIPPAVLYDECKKILGAMEEKTCHLLDEYMPVIKTLAFSLREEESLGRNRFEEIFASAVANG